MIHVGTIVIGLVILVACGAIVFWRGGRLERTVALIGLVCWSGAAAGQLLTGSNLVPVVIADLALAAALLVLVLRHHRVWLYALFAVEAARLILHAVDFRSNMPPGDIYRLTNNILSYLCPAIVVVASLWPKPKPKLPAA
jgi:hypothetical protein